MSSNQPFIAKIENINSVDDIKEFVNKEIFISIEEMRQDEDAIYWSDLIGCKVVDQNSKVLGEIYKLENHGACLLYTSPSPRDRFLSRMPSSA